MALGRWTNEKQKDLFIAAADMPRSPGHPFYVALNKLLGDAQFDSYVEKLCEPLCADGGRPGIPPGVFFRMLFAPLLQQAANAASGASDRGPPRRR